MGYAGGTTKAPTYRNIGDHAEAIQIDYDPERLSFEELLGHFWSMHTPTSPPWKRQYMSAILAHDDEQMASATHSMAQIAQEWGADIYTELSPLGSFTWAEEYHQKYRLQRHKALTQELLAMFPSFADFVNAPLVTRLNGLVTGRGDTEALAEQLGSLGLPARAEQELSALLRTGLKRKRRSFV